MIERRRALLGLGLGGGAAVALGLYGIPRFTAGDRATRSDDGAYLPPLDQDEVDLVSVMAEGIIPATDTPGAKGAGVPEFIAELYNSWYTRQEQEDFRAGLRACDAEAKSSHGHGFAKCAETQQVALLQKWDAAALGAPKPAEHPFGRFKTLVIIGYYTSKVGQDDELKTVMEAGQNDPDGPVFLPMVQLI